MSPSLCLQGKAVGKREYSTSNLEPEADFCTRGFSSCLGSGILQVLLILVMLGFVLNYLFLMLLVSVEVGKGLVPLLPCPPRSLEKQVSARALGGQYTQGCV